MRIALVGRDEATKEAIAGRLVDHYGFVHDGIYRPFRRGLERSLEAVGRQIKIGPDDAFGAVEFALRNAFGVKAFITMLTERLGTHDCVITDGIQPDDVKQLATLEFHIVIVTSTNQLSSEEVDYLRWFKNSKVTTLTAIKNDAGVDELYSSINNVVAGLAQITGQISPGVRQGINKF